MKQTNLFSKTRHDAPKDEVSKNAQLLIRAGYIKKEMAGVYSLLPLALKVMKKIENIVREEMNKVGGQELLMASLQDKNLWEKTDRWNSEKVDVWFKTKLQNDSELGLAFTHEEPVTQMIKEHVRSFRDLPVLAYQFQNKFRNEARAKSGIMRGREFIMKDLYSFCKSVEEQEEVYEKVKQAYLRIFEKVGLKDQTYLTYASGGSFSKYSHEFQTVCGAGEDLIYICDKCKIAVNKELIAENGNCPICGWLISGNEPSKSIEIANIFNLGTKFSNALELSYLSESGEKKEVFMGSYGIGIGRLMGTIVELFSDEKGIIWPETVAPFQVHLISLFNTKNEEEILKTNIKNTQEIYETLIKNNIEVLWDNRDARAGDKFADSDLIGIPKRVVISDKTLENNEVEVKDRKTGKIEMIKIDELLKWNKK